MTIDLKKSIYPLFSYLQYWLLQEDQYALQSPFIYRIYTDLLSYLSTKKSVDLDLEEIRKILREDQSKLKISAHGAELKKLLIPSIKKAVIRKFSASNRKFSQLFQYFCLLTPAERVLELGTCLGIHSRYLAKATIGTLYTFEGAEPLFQELHEFPLESNRKYIFENTKDSLPLVLHQIEKIDFALINTCQTSASSTSYFNLILPYLHKKSIVAIADIHLSKARDQAWEEIKKHPKIQLSIDFYECGILFFDKDIAQGEYILKI